MSHPVVSPSSHPERSAGHPELSEGSHERSVTESDSSAQPQNDAKEFSIDDDPKIPWHFWIGVSLAGIYLGYRFVQMLILAIRAIF
ncbi:MAG TPA: hypothetical protein PKB15_08650 [Acidimicrobiia bacterium]|nr:hypothetical protein [Acidimicrobiia bacterium]